MEDASVSLLRIASRLEASSRPDARLLKRDLAALAASLKDRPDYGSDERTSRYLDRRLTVQDPGKLKDWESSPEGKDLLFVIQSLQEATSGDDASSVPRLLKSLQDAAAEVLLYVQS